MANEKFSQIIDKNKKIKDYTTEIMYDKSSIGHLLKIVPVKE